MKISFQIIKEFIPDLKIKPQKLAEDLSSKLAEVERVEKAGEDFILEIENKALTHRPDCFSHWGIAREIAAIYLLDLKKPKIEESEQPSLLKENLELSVRIETPNCLRYLGKIFAVKIRESPLWLKERLVNLGIRPINNVVDITNYVMLKYGQPLHAFDLDKIHSSEIFVRQSKTKEKLITLDGQNRELDPSMMVIADQKESIALAGIMGGKSSEISPTTQKIVLESANFEMYSIRKTSAKIGLRTEASTRFEKGQDPCLAEIGLSEAEKMIKNLAEGKALSNLADQYPQPREEKKVNLTLNQVNKVLGLSLKREEVEKFLNSLQLKCEYHKDQWIVTIPTFRNDLNIPQDLIEEIARLYDYNNFQPVLPTRTIKASEISSLMKQRHEIREILPGWRFNEIYSYSFTNEESLNKTNLDPLIHLKLKNPLSAEATHLRRSLIPSLMEKTFQNLKNFSEIRFFEIGRHIIPCKNDLPQEIEHLALITGTYQTEDSFYQLKGVIEKLCAKLSINNLIFEPTTEIPFGNKKYQTKIFNEEKELIGYLTLVDKEILKNWNIDPEIRLIASELNLEQINKSRKGEIDYQPLSPHPVITQDLSFLISKKVNIQGLCRQIEEKNIANLIRVSFVDVFYDSKKMKPEQKSLTIRLHFQNPKKSLQHEEITPLVEKICQMLESDFQARIRK